MGPGSATRSKSTWNLLNRRLVAQLVGLLDRQPRRLSLQVSAPCGRPERSPGSCVMCALPGLDLHPVTAPHIPAARQQVDRCGPRHYSHRGPRSSIAVSRA